MGHPGFGGGAGEMRGFLDYATSSTTRLRRSARNDNEKKREALPEAEDEAGGEGCCLDVLSGDAAVSNVDDAPVEVGEDGGVEASDDLVVEVCAGGASAAGVIAGDSDESFDIRVERDDVRLEGDAGADSSGVVVEAVAADEGAAEVAADVDDAGGITALFIDSDEPTVTPVSARIAERGSGACGVDADLRVKRGGSEECGGDNEEQGAEGFHGEGPLCLGYRRQVVTEIALRVVESASATSVSTSSRH